MKITTLAAALLLCSLLPSKTQSIVKPVPFSELDGISVGNAQDDKAKTGVTVFFFPQGAKAAVNILGGGPASRETSLLELERNTHDLNALVFGGGSSFGLEASHGVMECLEQNGIGYDTGAAVVPIVCQSDIYDLSYGRSDIRPDKKMGFLACSEAIKSSNPVSGNIGAGTGATVGKPGGMRTAQKSGIGYAAAKINGVVVGVAAVVNAYGDIYFDGKKIAGMTNRRRNGYEDAVEALFKRQPADLLTGNTTLVAIFTNGDFTNTELQKIADIAASGMARAIRPVFTMSDGDTVYALSTGKEKVKSDVNVVGTLAADLIERAIKDAVTSARISDEEYMSNIK